MKDVECFKIDCNGIIKGLTYDGKLLTNIRIPSKIDDIPITGIADYAFFGNEFLETITMPNTIETIGYGAFWGCSNLKSVKLSKNIKIIRTDTFRGCINLISIKLPDSIERIGESSFANCVKLKNVYINKNIKNIRSKTFHKCVSLKTIDFNGTKDDWNKIDIDPDNKYLNHIKIKFNE